MLVSVPGQPTFEPDDVKFDQEDEENIDEEVLAVFMEDVQYFKCNVCQKIGREISECIKCRKVFCQECDTNGCCGRVLKIQNEYVKKVHGNLVVKCDMCDGFHRIADECPK